MGSDLTESTGIAETLASYSKKITTAASLQICIDNQTSHFFHESAFAWSYRHHTPGDAALGKQFPGNTVYCYSWNVGDGWCVYQVAGVLYYRTGGQTKDVRLSVKTAPEGKCWVKVGWRIVYTPALASEGEPASLLVEAIPE